MTSPVHVQRLSISLKSLYDSLQGLISSGFPSLWLYILLLMPFQSRQAIFPFLHVEPQNLCMYWSPVTCGAHCHAFKSPEMLHGWQLPRLTLTLSIALMISPPCSFVLSRICLHHLEEQTLTDTSSNLALCYSPASPSSGF